MNSSLILAIEPLPAPVADAIVGWRYAGEYAFYDMTADPEDLAHFRDPANWLDGYDAVRDARGELAGLFHFARDGDVVVVGLGMRPDLTGRGLGRGFLEAGLAFARGRYQPARFRLAVAAFNARAIRVYERADFRETRRFMQHTNGAKWEFVELERGPAS